MKKTVLVTGGSRGIGRAICIQLAQDLDFHVLINYQSNKDAALSVAKEIEALAKTAEILPFDVSNREEVKEALTNWKTSHPNHRVEAIVNNAGITKDGLFMWMEESDWHSVISTSLDGFFHVTQFFIQDMLRQRFGRIVNIVSVSGLKGNPGQTNYAAAKGAVIAATKSLAQEVGKRNITVNAVAPGFIESDMTAEMDQTELKKHIPLNRFGQAKEVADLVSFLVSEKAAYITGEVININGGIYS